ncbi:hypothetical protein FEFB_11180 [Fructobacillus sp. EFB-N1]|uniref:Uncharacterized protein n=1 Tax=Fructobacillus cardui TaxID=2893170 RepID=A0ABN9YMU2_9LACO|nr:hypothetical protein FEFB_11180 [Fructobacillus sp. EFB-N1]CAK1233474.1 unnamed protein product [Fructobacillus cardui]CAK1236133.1 unnamed protein product [Fructobacillus cardui]
MNSNKNVIFAGILSELLYSIFGRFLINMAKYLQ